MDALTFARLAARAYDVPPDIGQADGPARATVGHLDGDLVITFRGTDNAASVLADADAHPVKIDGLGGVHHGFWRALHDVLQDLLDVVRPAQSIVLVGHSEGGALALLFGAVLCMWGKPPKAVFAFEAPRISADDTIAGLYSRARVTPAIYKNGTDPVPDVPRLFADWQHPAKLIHIGGGPAGLLDIGDHAIERVILALQ